MSITLSTNLDENSAIPYFLWDEPLTIGELKKRLDSDSIEERTRMLGKILREARDTDVWKFTTPQKVWRNSWKSPFVSGAHSAGNGKKLMRAKGHCR